MQSTTLIPLLLIAAMSCVSSRAYEPPGGRGRPDRRGEPAAESPVRVAVSFRFGSGDAQEIRAWFADPGHAAGLPPGLAKRERLPPGLEKQLVRNGTLPPGLEKRLHPLPAELRRRIARPPDGVELYYVAGKVLAIHVRSSKILDVVADIVIPL